MKKTKVPTRAKTPMLEAIHDSVKVLHEVGLMDQMTLREFDSLCLKPIPVMKASDIRKIRTRSHVSQAVFAALLNTSVSTIQKWEIGQKKPAGTALKLLHIVHDKGIEALF